MPYGYSKKVTVPFTEALARTKAALAANGFGVLTEIDVRDTMKTKLGVQYANYMILGACNPPLAHRALQAEKEAGLLLPCNVIVYEDGTNVLVSAILPSAAMGMLKNHALETVAAEAENKLRTAIDSI